MSTTEQHRPDLAPVTTTEGADEVDRIDRMVDHGLVMRRADAQDRRMVRVQLTADGRRRVDAAMESLVASEHEVLSSLDDDERQQLAGLLRTLLRPIEHTSGN